MGYTAQTPAEEVRSERLLLRRVHADDAVGIALAVGASLDYLKPWMAWATREAAEPRTQLIRVAEADGTPWDTSPWYRLAGSEPDSPMIMRVKKMPMERT